MPIMLVLGLMSSQGRKFILSFFNCSVCTEMTSTYLQPDLKLALAGLMRKSVFGVGSVSARDVLFKYVRKIWAVL